MKKSIQLITLIFVLCFISLSFAKEVEKNKVQSTPKNIIIMIGDGMGLGTISAYYLSNTNANISKFKNVGLVTTFADGSLITDSAAGGTAIATGFKTKNGFISTLPNGTPLKTVMEIGKEKGKATGIVVTCSITHATPAVFYSHVSSRANESEIATFATNQTVDVFIGGGLNFFIPTVSSSSSGYETNTILTNSLNLLSIMSSLGYNIITNYDTFYQYNPSKFEKSLILLEPMHLPSAISGNRKTSLSEMTKKALEILSKNKNGFIMMIEGSQIDWEAHGNNSNGIIAEIDDFDKAIGVVLEFASKNSDTLVIVTADHETGGVGIIGGVIGKNIVTRFLSKDHTGVMVPIFSYGPGAENFIGFIDNTFIGKRIMEFLTK